MNVSWIAVVAALAVTTTGTAWSAEPASTLAACAKAVNLGHPPRADGPDRAVLSRGVNLTDTFHDEVSPARLAQDDARLRQLGFRHVRIPVEPEALTWPAPGAAATGRLQRLDAAVCAAVSAGLAVIVDMHPEGAYKLKDGAAPDALDKLAEVWDRLAARYAVITPDLMIFEALNEPTLTPIERWQTAQQTLREHIRRAAPHHTILLTASPDSTAGALGGLQPVADPNVAYVFHFYSPMVFTHQGADWSSAELGTIKGLAYPAEPGNFARVRRRAMAAMAAIPDTDASEVREPLGRYGAEYASANGIRDEIDIAAHWAELHHVALVVTEFGVYGGAAPSEARAAWLRDVRQSLDARGIGWTVWEYRGGFGIDHDLDRPCGAPASMQAALGLCGKSVKAAKAK